MFTIISRIASVYIGRYAEDCNADDRSNITQFLSDDEIRTAILHARQDIKLLCFVLFAVLTMLGIIADLILVEIVVDNYEKLRNLF